MINEWATPRGYTFINDRPTKEVENKPQTVPVVDTTITEFHQENDGGKQPPEQLVRFILGKEALDKTTWTVRYPTDKRFSLHNHEPSRE